MGGGGRDAGVEVMLRAIVRGIRQRGAEEAVTRCKQREQGAVVDGIHAMAKRHDDGK